MSVNTGQKIIKNKVGLLNLAKMLGNVSDACKVMGYSRHSFYRFKELHEKGGELALQAISRRKPVLKNRVEEHIEKAVVELSLESRHSVRSVWRTNWPRIACEFLPQGCVSMRHDLQSFYNRKLGSQGQVDEKGPNRWGSYVLVQGAVRTREYEREGVKQRIVELRADTIGKLDRAARRLESEAEPEPADA